MRRTAALVPVALALALAPSVAQARRPTLADVPGVVIGHEPSPNPLRRIFGTARYVGSPTIAILPNGHYVAAHDLFRRGGGETEKGKGITLVYRSTDRGASWTRVARVEGAFWSTLFAHGGALWLWGYRKLSGDLVVRRSTDEGRTWTDPRDAATGLLVAGSFGGTPNSPVVHDGRLWIAQSGTRVASVPVGADLLAASSWTLSRGRGGDPAWLGGTFTIWTEGQVVASPALGVHVLPKVKDRPFTALLRFDAPGAAPRFDPALDFAPLPGAEKKFGVRYDPVSDRFWALTNPVLPQHQPRPTWSPTWSDPFRRVASPAMVRNAAAIYSSRDLRTWEFERIFLYHPDQERAAFQYLNFLIEGDDLVVVSRTAFHVGFWKPPRGHDSNLLTFHRVPDFRRRPANPYPPGLAPAPGPVTTGLTGAVSRGAP